MWRLLFKKNREIKKKKIYLLKMMDTIRVAYMIFT